MVLEVVVLGVSKFESIGGTFVMGGDGHDFNQMKNVKNLQKSFQSRDTFVMGGDGHAQLANHLKRPTEST